MFHEFRDIISEIKNSDRHFHNLFEKHNKLDEQIQELEKSHSDQFEIESMKKEKLKLKDEIYTILVKYKNEQK